VAISGIQHRSLVVSGFDPARRRRQEGSVGPDFVLPAPLTFAGRTFKEPRIGRHASRRKGNNGVAAHCDGGRKFTESHSLPADAHFGLNRAKFGLRDRPLIAKTQFLTLANCSEPVIEHLRRVRRSNAPSHSLVGRFQKRPTGGPQNAYLVPIPRRRPAPSEYFRVRRWNIAITSIGAMVRNSVISGSHFNPSGPSGSNRR